MPRWFSSVMRDNKRLLWQTLAVWGLCSWVAVSAYGQLTGSRVLPVPQAESSPATSSAVDQDSGTLQSSSSSAVLSVEAAFALSALLEGDSAILLVWDIAPGHYLYRDKFQFSDANGKSLMVTLPAATTMTDEYFGETSVYFDRIQLRIPLTQLPKNDSGEYLLQLVYQGCAKDRYCYPPTSKEVRLTLPR